MGSLEEQRALSALSTLRNQEYAVILRTMTLAQVEAEYKRLAKHFSP